MQSIEFLFYKYLSHELLRLRFNLKEIKKKEKASGFIIACPCMVWKLLLQPIYFYWCINPKYQCF
jgi:hypothetical protein